MASIGDHRTVRDRATGYAVGRGNAIASAGESRDRMVGATDVCDFDELVVQAIWSSDAKFGNNQLTGGRHGCWRIFNRRYVKPGGFSSSCRWFFNGICLRSD